MARNMKDSGIEWIGEIPEGWEIRKIKNNFMIYAGATPKSEKVEYWDGDIPWITPADFKTTDKYASYGRKSLTALGYDSCGTTLVPAGSIIFSKRAPVGSVVIAKNALCTNQGCLACIPNDAVNSTYFYYCMSIFTEQFELVSAGTTFKEIAASTFASFLLPCPPLSQQNEIVTFLDKEISRIDSMFSKTRSSIEEYKKLKQSVITQAATKTIYDDFGNPSKFRKLRSLCDVLSKGTTPKDIETQNDEFYCIRYLKSENIVSNQLNLNPTFFITAETNNSLERSKLNSGDILFVIAGASIGKVAITTADFLPANTNQAVAFIRLSSSYQYATKYIWYFLQSDVVKQLIALSAVQSAQPNLSLEDLGAMRLPLPDQMDCLKITDYLDAKCAEIDGLIAKKEQLVKELESYKKSLIYEVVTGKREV